MYLGATSASSGTLTVSSNGIFTSGTGLTMIDARECGPVAPPPSPINVRCEGGGRDTCRWCKRPVPHGDYLCAGCDDREHERREEMNEYREEMRLRSIAARNYEEENQ
ncbi:MAG: hypothetical protein WCS43_11840 [Verrucomicrobiota bacterium]